VPMRPVLLALGFVVAARVRCADVAPSARRGFQLRYRADPLKVARVPPALAQSPKLAALSGLELQALAKAAGVPANRKSADIIAPLEARDEGTPNLSLAGQEPESLAPDGQGALEAADTPAPGVTRDEGTPNLSLAGQEPESLAPDGQGALEAADTPAPGVTDAHRAGFVSILGVPNVGKSTLMNRLVGERLSIATSKPQTTRHSIAGILSGDDYQIVFQDTPGVLEPHYKLQEGMMNFVRSSVIGADVVIMVVDIFQEVGALIDEKLDRQLRSSPAALLIVLNKVDLLDPNMTAPDRVADRVAELGTAESLVQRWAQAWPCASVVAASAKRGDVDHVLSRIVSLLPLHAPYYDRDQITDRPERFFAAEMLREAILEHYHEEVPYCCECKVEAFKETDKLLRIRAVIYVSHESQKGIVIGKGGAALKKVGTKARSRLEHFFQKQVYLETRVKVRPNWRQDPRSLEEFGYT